MKKTDIKIGSIYSAKVSDKLTDVRIDAEHAGGGWDATNLATKKKVRIKSAQRLRAPAMTGEEATAVAAADQENARTRDERAASPDGQTASERAMTRASKPKKPAAATTAATGAAGAKGKAGAAPKARDAKAATRANTAATGAKGKPKAAAKATTAKAPARAKRGGDTAPGEKRISLLDRAAAILAKAKEPMGCKDIVEQALADGWTTNGKTPGATLYAAMTREIATKGTGARFEKVDRGRFQLASAKKGA